MEMDVRMHMNHELGRVKEARSMVTVFLFHGGVGQNCKVLYPGTF
jgi:hypothetical protein